MAKNINEVKTAGDMAELLINYFTNIEKTSLNQLTRGIITQKELEEKAYTYLKMQDINAEEDMIKEAIKEFEKQVWGYGILDELINDPDISDINLLAYDNIRVKKKGKRMPTDVKFKDKQDYGAFVRYIAVKNKVSLSDLNALQTFTDNVSNDDFILRITAATPFTMDNGQPCVNIRKISKHKITLDKLVEFEMMSEETKQYLIDIIRQGKSIIVCGKGASGKTTLLNALLDVYPEDRRGLVIQENMELFSNTHPEMIFQHIVLNRGEGKIKYGLQDLAEKGLVFDLDLFVIGEIKGAEALYFLNAAYTGHSCWCSIHGVNSTEAIDKLADYVKYASDYKKEEAMQMLKHMDVVIFLKDFKIHEISEVEGWDNENKKLIYKDVYRLNK